MKKCHVAVLCFINSLANGSLVTILYVNRHFQNPIFMTLLTKKTCLFAFLLSVYASSYSQILKGKITDSNHEPVPFAVVYDETTLTSSTCNTEGYFEIRLDPGKHSIIIKAMGYYQVKEEVVIETGVVTRNVILREQPVAVKEVIITPGNEDPAYAIMRKVIARAPAHLVAVKEYVAEIYLKGTIHVEKIPRLMTNKVLANDTPLKSGDVFMQESVNLVTFHAPDSYEQKVLSSNGNFPNQGSQINPMSLIKSSLYESEIDVFISPLSRNAFRYYQYKYEGFFDEGGAVIFKIRVIPKRDSQQLMKGYIYIVDRLWCLHSFEMAVSMFFGTMNYSVIYSPVKGNAWLPVSHRIAVKASLMGAKAGFTYVSAAKFTSVVLNSQLAGIQAVDEHASDSGEMPEPKTRNQKEIESLLAKEELTNRDMIKIAGRMARENKGDTIRKKSLEIKEEEAGKTRVIIDSGAMKKDTFYWNTIRPIPLSSIESDALGKSLTKDIAADTVSTDKDSASQKRFLHFLISETGFNLFNNRTRIVYEGLINHKKINFNTVDGFLYKQTFRIQHNVDSSHFLSINPGAAWAFSREKLMWWTTADYNYAPMRNGTVRFYIGSLSADYNGESGINSIVNSLASLVFRRNYLKMYNQDLVYLQNSIEIATGLNLVAQVGYRKANTLENNSDFSFFYRKSRDYSPNIPGRLLDSPGRNVYNEEAYWDITLDYTPRYYYKISGGRKHYQHSAYPTFFIRNRMAFPGILNSTADYMYLEAGMRQQINWGIMNEFSWSIKGGMFLNVDNLYAMDAKYFNNQSLPVIFTNAKGAFRLLSFYRYAVTDKYAEAHAQYAAPYLMIKQLPFLSNKLWDENLHLNYLAGGGGFHYWEVGYSVGKIFMIANIGIFAGFDKDRFKSWGVQLSLGL